MSKSKDEELLGDFLKRHEGDIGKIITAFAKNMEGGPRHKQKGLLTVMSFMLVTVAIVSLLGYAKVISGDSITFLVGSIIGYSFAFLKGFLTPATS
jgi:hypothetical protein